MFILYYFNKLKTQSLMSSTNRAWAELYIYWEYNVLTQSVFTNLYLKFAHIKQVVNSYDSTKEVSLVWDAFLIHKAFTKKLYDMWRSPYIYQFPSLKLGGILCLLVGVRTLLLSRSRHKNPPIHMPRDLHRVGSW